MRGGALKYGGLGGEAGAHQNWPRCSEHRFGHGLFQQPQASGGQQQHGRGGLAAARHLRQAGKGDAVWRRGRPRGRELQTDQPDTKPQGGAKQEGLIAGRIFQLQTVQKVQPACGPQGADTLRIVRELRTRIATGTGWDNGHRRFEVSERRSSVDCEPESQKT